MIKTQQAISRVRGTDTNTEIELIKKDIETIRDNHLVHLAEDIDRVEKKVDKIDARIWWVLGILVASTIGTLLANMIG